MTSLADQHVHTSCQRSDELVLYTMLALGTERHWSVTGWMDSALHWLWLCECWDALKRINIDWYWSPFGALCCCFANKMKLPVVPESCTTFFSQFRALDMKKFDNHCPTPQFTLWKALLFNTEKHFRHRPAKINLSKDNHQSLLSSLRFIDYMHTSHKSFICNKID